jgi:hypothetical protein
MKKVLKGMPIRWIAFLIMLMATSIAITYIVANNNDQSENMTLDLTSVNVSIGEDLDDDNTLDREEVWNTINLGNLSIDSGIILNYLLNGTFPLSGDKIDLLSIEDLIDESTHDVLVKVEGRAYLKSGVPIEFAMTTTINSLNFTLSATMITATGDVDPDTLNLGSKGKWITCYIELPEGWNVSQIDRTTILLNNTIPVDPFWVDKPLESVIGDYDNDTVSDLMVKFNRTEVSQYILSKGITDGYVTLTITGQLYDTQYSFEAKDTIRVISK